MDPLNAEQVKVQFTMSREVLAKMKHAMDLLGATVARDDVAALFEKLLDMAIPALEKKKFAATDRSPRERRARRRQPTRARSPPTCSARSGSATAAAARSRARQAGAARALAA